MQVEYCTWLQRTLIIKFAQVTGRQRARQNVHTPLQKSIQTAVFPMVVVRVFEW